jgi:hypothetical protein
MIDGNAVITSYGIKKDIAKTRVCNIALKLFCPKLYDLL